MFRTASHLLLVFLVPALYGQYPFNGPMPGYSEHLEVAIWLQCHGPCTAQLEYWPTDDPANVQRTGVLHSDKSTGHVLRFTPSPLEPGTTYEYRVFTGDTVHSSAEPWRFKSQGIWRYRTDAPDFTMATGSCTYINQPEHDRPGTAFGADLQIFDAIADQQPDLMLWLGDNIYLREPDFSRTGFLHRYTHLRSAPEIQRLLRSTHHYAIWDDHDFGRNDADASNPHAELAREMFDLFWANPPYGAYGSNGITTGFGHSDIDFFLMDGRTHRVPGHMRTVAPQLLGREQMDRLMIGLKYSKAPFKIVAIGNQVLNPTAVFENYSTMPEERAELLRRIEEEGITGVVFLTGDRHFTELSELKLKDGRVIRDLTVSPITAGVNTREEANPLRVEGTKVQKRNFATLSFTGPKDQRTMTIRVKGADGQLLWERAILQDQGQ